MSEKEVQEEIAKLRAELAELKWALAKARNERDLLQDLYNSLIEALIKSVRQ